MWGSRDTNQRGMRLAEFIATTNLEVTNRGTTPTFVNSVCETLIDLTLASSTIASSIADWKVSEEETLSDHREINFWIRLGTTTEPAYRNPRATKWNTFRELGSLGIRNTDLSKMAESPEDLDLKVERLT